MNICRESDIHRFFRGFGRIKQVVLKNNYGFCEFLDYRDARAAVRNLHGDRLLGTRVTVELARGQDEAREGIVGKSEDKFCIYIGQLPSDTTEADIARFFDGYGRLTLIILRSQAGYCYAYIEDKEDAEEAVHELKGRKILGQKIALELIERGSDLSGFEFPRFRLRVSNLSQNTSSTELKEYMMKAGDILACQAHIKTKGYGEVEFRSWRNLTWALDHLDDTKLCGRNIQLTEVMEG